METAIQNRVRLWLRSERAFGLSAVPAPVLSVADSPAAPSAPAPPAKSASDTIDRSCDLFSSAARAPVATGIAPVDVAELSSSEKLRQLAALNENEVRNCTRCRLHEQRTNTVFGEGSVDAKVVFVGEGPGENEDLQGRPFVGRAGDMLNKWIAAMGLRRDDVYIANIVKCRPPGNREPAPDEVATCTPYLQRQLEIIRPQVIVTLGKPAAQFMLQQKVSITRMRGMWQMWRGIKLMPTFHPAYILRNYTGETRAAVWSDLQSVMMELGFPVPEMRKKT